MRRDSTFNPESAFRREDASVEASTRMSLILDMNFSPYSTNGSDSTVLASSPRSAG